MKTTRKDRAWQYEEKLFESSARNDGKEKGSNSRKRTDQELVDTMMARAGKVEGLYTGKEKKTFKKWRQSV